MRESTVVERFIRMGREEGRQEALQQALVTVLTRRFGALPAGLLRRIEAVTDPAVLQNAFNQALDLQRLEGLAL